MRPPEFTGGNPCSCAEPLHRADAMLGFNEAAGIHRRKPVSDRLSPAGRAARRRCSFNEAAGIHRRKPGVQQKASDNSPDLALQ